MYLVDTHTHLFAEQFNEDRTEMVNRAIEAGVTKMFLPNIDKDTVDDMFALSREFPENCFPMMGLHPSDVKEDYKEQLNVINSRLKEVKIYGIGETGIDLYWDKTFIKEQEEALRIQIGWALEMDLPIILHTRSADEETIAIVKDYVKDGLRGIFHCFGGTADQAKRIVDMGFYLGIGGVLTFKNSNLAETISDIPLESLVLETDSPYLAPHPHRGKRNESSYVTLVADKLADVRGISGEDVIDVTTANAKKIFGI